jgi:hypothetical protein
MAVADVVAELYQHKPVVPLFHYTSLGALLGIISDASLQATDVRFLSDAAELGHTGNILRNAIYARKTLDPFEDRLLGQFEDWLRHRLTNGNMLFVVCFTASGNLLSQWRSYTPPSKGISLGFAADKLSVCALNQDFRLARCVYQPGEQKQIAERLIEEVIALAHVRGETTDRSKRGPNDSFYPVFEEIEDDVLRVAALLKHQAFHEEQEWRAISKIHTNYVVEPIQYREGKSTLVPYIKFTLPKDTDRRIDIAMAIIGPTPRGNNSLTSINNYLSKHGASPRLGTTYCGIPYRTW